MAIPKKILIEASKDPWILGYINPSSDIHREPILDTAGEVVGFFTPRKEKDYIRVGAMYVKPEHRNKGLAAKAISKYMAGKTSKALVEDTNIASAKALQKAGFKKGNKSTEEGMHWYTKEASDAAKVYRPRATILLNDGLGNILAWKNKWGDKGSAFAFPGGGVNPDEDLDEFTPWNRPATPEEVLAGASKEAIEEMGFELSNPEVLGSHIIDVEDPEWRAAIKKNWKNNDFHGVHEHYVSAGKGAINLDSPDTHGDFFKGEYYPIDEVMAGIQKDLARSNLRKATNWGGAEANIGQLKALENIKKKLEKTSAKFYHGSPHDVDNIEPRVPSKPGDFPGGHTGIYTHPDLAAAAMYALARDKENTRRKWGVTASGKLLAMPDMELNPEGYVYEYDTDNFIAPPDDQLAIGYALLGDQKPIAKHKVNLSDYLSNVYRAKSRETFRDEFAELAKEDAGLAKVSEAGIATKTNPELWSRAKSEAKARMGGKHSARAMQLATKIYKDRGGDYAGKKPSASQNKMRKWTKQDWQTRPGTSEIAEKSDGRTSRYLPKAKWDSLSKSEQKATDAKKLKSDKQYVDNTDAAKVKGNAKYIKQSEAEFKPDISAADLKAMGVYDQVYGDAESEASMEKWPAHWLHEQDPLGWLQWYERYSQGRRTEDDARQIKRWASFKARHGSQYSKNPTPRRKAALRNWGIDADRLLDNMEKQSKVLTTRGRDRIKEKNFALDNRRYPIHDINHARSALSMVAKHGTPAEQEQVRRAVYAKYPGIANRAKQADYRDRATLLLHNGQGGVLAAKNQHPENPIYPPFFFPGGGVFKEEGIRNSVTEEEIQEGLRREALEEIGHKLKNIDSLGMQPLEVNMGDAWTARQLAKKGVPYKGFREHIRAAMSDGIDNSILGSEGDDFTAYNPEYINANELASALESSLPGLRKAGDPTLVTSRLQTIEALKRLGNIKQANYRDRATLILHDNKGNVFAAPDVDGGAEAPYFFPGGGVYEEEGLFPVPDSKLIEQGLRREALEELGYKIKDIQDFGFLPTEIDKDREWQEATAKKRGVPYKGYREHLRAAIVDNLDESILGSAGDSFHQWNPKYLPADQVASAIMQHAEKNKGKLNPSEYRHRLQQADFINGLKQAAYRDRATLFLHDGKGNVLAAPELENPTKMPYHFPGGGVYEEESEDHPIPDNNLVAEGLKREALEELGYKIKNIQDFGVSPMEVDMNDSWKARAAAKRGIFYDGIREHLRAAEVEAEDNSLLNSAGDSFSTYYPEYVNATDLSNSILNHTSGMAGRLSKSEYNNRLRIANFIKNLEKTSEEKRYRPKVQGLLYTPDLKVLASKSQGAGSGLREFANYKFPGGGIEPGESLIDAAKKELLEETGYSTAGDPFEFGMPATTVDWDEAFRQQALKKGRDFHGEISHFLAAPVGARDLSLHGKEGDELLDADFVPIDSLIADLEHTSKLPDNEYAVFDKTKLDAARKFKEHMAKKAYYIGRRLAIKSFVSDS